MTPKKWLEDMSKGLGRELEAVTLQGLKINLVQTGLVRCTFLVPQNLSDKDGNWDGGAMAVLVDDVAACTVGTRAFVKASVDFHLSFYSHAKIHGDRKPEKYSPKLILEITGQKRTMPISPGRETKRKCLVENTEVNLMETRKVEAVMMRKCGGILEKLMKHRHGWVFNEPVDVVALGLSDDYHQVVKSPMDLGTVKSKLDENVYRNPIDFAKDVRLTFDNALLYNRKGEDVHTMATVLLEMFEKLFDPVQKKFEVERQRVVDEHEKLSKPLAEENPRMKKEMSDCERDGMGMVLQDLAAVYLDEILQIVAKQNSDMTTPDEDGEIEVDMKELDSETMRDLHRFARLKFKAGQNNKGTKTR